MRYDFNVKFSDINIGDRVTYKFELSCGDIICNIIGVEFNDVSIDSNITINPKGNTVISGTILITEFMLTDSPQRPYNYSTMRFFDINNTSSIFNVSYSSLIITKS